MAIHGVDRVLRLFNPSRRRARWPIKLGVGLVVTTLVLFPRVDLLVRNIGHWARLDLMIEPDAPGLAKLEAEVRKRLPADAAPAEALRVTEAVVYEAVAYAFDWETWGNADYLPRVEETLAAGREDCDGQAVVAASLLKRMGYDARLMSDVGHVWVWTPEGESMSPSPLAGGEVFLRQGERGAELNWGAVFNWRSIVFDWGRNLSYGIAVFPMWRELALVVMAWVLMLGRRTRWGVAITGLGLAIGGWMLVRWMCGDFWNPAVWAAWGGLGMAAGGFGMAVFSGVGGRTLAPSVIVAEPR